MKHHKLNRSLRGQSLRSLRARLRAEKQKVKEKEAELQHLSRENSMLSARLRSATSRPLSVPSGFLDMVMEKYAAALGRTMANKVLDENPELAPFARRASEELARYAKNHMTIHFDPSYVMDFYYEELADGESFKLSFQLDRITMNYADNLKMVNMMRYPNQSDTVYEMPPRPIPITSRDLDKHVFSA